MPPAVIRLASAADVAALAEKPTPAGIPGGVSPLTAIGLSAEAKFLSRLRENALYEVAGQREIATAGGKFTSRRTCSASRQFGCARVVFNDALAARQDARAAGRPYLTDGDLSARLTAAKASPQRAWLGEVSAVILQQALADLTAAYLTAAYRNFFASAAGQRKGPRVALPRFRSRKDHRQAMRFTRNARFAVTAGGKLRLPKIGEVPVRWSRRLPAEPSSVTVIKDAAARNASSARRRKP